ncbi:MAG: heme-binding protein, partial [Ruminococcaceae bacterium]|nr:heme-binding protein [Oscillospiraceae bacterium]
MDDAYIASYDVAVNKAFTVVALKMSTIALRPLAQPGASLYGIQFTNGGKIVIFGGGDPICDAEGKIIGGLGVSGGSEEQDTALSAYGKKYFEKQM